MKYKVTPRGWVVFTSLGILLIYGIFSLFQLLTPEDESKSNDLINNKNSSVVEKQSVIDDAEISEETSEIETNEETTEESSDSETDAEETDEITEETDAEETEETSEKPVDDLDIPTDQIDLLYFDKNVATFRDEHKLVLDNWIMWLKADEKLLVTIEGHINGYPKYEDTDYGLSISNERGLVIKLYLLEAGIDEERITLINMGSRDQIDTSDDYSKHYLNRRAIIYFNKE